jgi:CheY-like chemotaxis protein
VAPAVTAAPVTLRVLVIDDEPSIRSALERLLRRHGHEVRTAAGPLEALAKVSQEPFDAVFCDVHLGEGSAAALYHDAIRLDATLAGRFVFSSGAALAPELCRLVEDSGSLQLAKPFETRDLLAALEQAARGSKAMATAG